MALFLVKCYIINPKYCYIYFNSFIYFLSIFLVLNLLVGTGWQGRRLGYEIHPSVLQNLPCSPLEAFTPLEKKCAAYAGWECKWVNEM